MKRLSRKQIISMLLAIIFAFSLFPLQGALAMEQNSENGRTISDIFTQSGKLEVDGFLSEKKTLQIAEETNPFRLMYDSNELLPERLEEIPDQYFESAEVRLSDSQGRLNIEKQADGLFTDIRPIEPDVFYQEKISATRNTVLNLVEAERLEEVARLNISERTIEQIERAIDEVNENRYIIKYHSDSGESLTNALARSSFDISSSEREGKTEVLVLEERVNPSRLAETLQAAGAGRYIEYIQPDFVVGFASEGGNLQLELIEAEVISPVIDEDDETLFDIESMEQQERLDESEALEIFPEKLTSVPTEIVFVDALYTCSLPEKGAKIITASALVLDQNGFAMEGLVEYTLREDVQGISLNPISGEITISPDAEAGFVTILASYEGLQAETLLVLTEEQQEAREVIVALIDTGVDITHPDLADYIVGGWNFVDQNDMVYDSKQPIQSAHGTHLAGIIVSAAGKYGAKVMPLKVFGSHGAYTSDIIAAIAYAEENGAEIANCSFGSTSDNPALRGAIANSSMLFVCSVGNARTDLEETPIYPASFGLPNIISVTSTNADGGLSYFSNYSASVVDLAACGRDVVSTYPEGEHSALSGTSQSAAQVSGAAAAVLGFEGYELAGFELKERLLDTADRLSNLQQTVNMGRQVNLSHALHNIQPDAIQSNIPGNDFDVFGYQPTPSENWELFSSLEIIQISAGKGFTLALASDGTVWAWGKNTVGQCGTGQRTAYELCSKVIGLTDIVYISAGSSHSLAVTASGEVWGWGHNMHGQIGDGAHGNRFVPVQALVTEEISEVSAGSSHSLALTRSGTVQAWGYNGDYRLGNEILHNSPVPVSVSGLSNVISVSAGNVHSLALKSNGQVWSWGSNEYGQVGGGNYSSKPAATQVSGVSSVIQISAGSFHSLALRGDGTVFSWGRNNKGQLGFSSGAKWPTPTLISGLQGCVEVSAGALHSIARISHPNGQNQYNIYCWGQNISGELGTGDTVNKTTPTSVFRLDPNVKSISAGEDHSVALRSNGENLYGWGSNEGGQLGQSPDSFTMITTPDMFAPPSAQPSISFSENQFRFQIPEAPVTSQSHSLGVTGNGYFNGINFLNTVEYAISPAFAGVLLEDGVLTISALAEPCQFEVTANYYHYSTTTVITLYKTGAIPLREVKFIPNEYSISIPQNGIEQLTVNAYAIDIENNEREDFNITYSLSSSAEGVTINPTTGVVTVSATAQSGVLQLIASCGELSATATLTITEGYALEIDAAANGIYHVVLSASGMTGFDGITYTLVYDASMLLLLDAAAQTPAAETGVGAIEGTGVTITSIEDGIVCFTFEQNIPQNMQWSGAITVLKFSGKANGTALVRVQ